MLSEAPVREMFLDLLKRKKVNSRTICYLEK
jgi:hypothetical protein